MLIDNTEDKQIETIGDKIPELKLNIKDGDIIKLIKLWKDIADDGKDEMKKVWEMNKKFWLGVGGEYNKEFSKFHENRIFSGLETFLPILTRQKPEPTIEIERKKELDIEELALVNEATEKIQDRLNNLLDLDKIKLKMKTVGRFWSIYQLGISMVEWDSETDRPTVKILRPDKVLLDTRATIEEGEYTGEFIGVIKVKTAGKMKELFQRKSKEINSKTNGKDGTMVKYIEWWTNDMVVYELDGVILDKIKNPNWNFDEDLETVDEFGDEEIETIEGKNHFKSPKMPFSFFSVYNLHNKLYDETGIIQQSIPNQRTVNDRIQQIKKNADNQNNSVVTYGLDEQQGAKALAVLNGGGMLLFNNKQEQGIERFGGTPLTSDIYNDLNVNKQSIDSNFATNAVTRGENTRDQTVRGKIISKSSDESRIGFIAEYLEQFADSIYNHLTQLIYVYDEHLKDDLATFDYTLLVSVKEGSMIPKDPLTARNEAIDLFNSGAMDILTLYEKLDFDNPKEVAIRTAIYRADPMLYLTKILEFNPQEQPQEPQAIDTPETPLIPQVPPQVPQTPNILPQLQ